MQIDDKEAEALWKGQERLALMLCALGRNVGGPEVLHWLRRLWRGEDPGKELGLDLPAGGEAEPGKEATADPLPGWIKEGPTGKHAEWVRGALAMYGATQKPDETDKRLAEMNGALAALENARSHIEALQRMTTNWKVTLAGWEHDVNEIQRRLRELVGEEDF